MNTEEMLAAMRPKPKVTEEVKATDISPLGMDDIEIPVKEVKKELPMIRQEEVVPRILEAATKSEEKLKKQLTEQPDTNSLLASLIIQVRRTNTLLDQMRLIALGQPISDYIVNEVKENGSDS